jgi:hypothetical protein
MRKRATYCMTGSPTSAVKRAAKADRDIAAPEASDATVHGREGSRWTRRRAPPIWGSESAPNQPVCALGSFSIQERIAWMTRMSESRVTTVSPPGRSSLASAAMSRRVLPIHSIRGELEAST